MTRSNRGRQGRFYRLCLEQLYNIAHDPSETNNLAAEHPDKVAALQQRINELASQAEKPILLQIEVKNIIKRMHLSPALPDDLESLDAER